MNVGHIKEHQVIPDSFFVRGTCEARLPNGEIVIDRIYSIRLPIYGMALHDYGYARCFSQRVLAYSSRRGFMSWWRPVPGAEWITDRDSRNRGAN